MKKLFGQMAADKRWQVRRKTSRHCESEKNVCCMAEFFPLAEKGSETLKTDRHNSSCGRGCCHRVGTKARWQP